MKISSIEVSRQDYSPTNLQGDSNLMNSPQSYTQDPLPSTRRSTNNIVQTYETSRLSETSVKLNFMDTSKKWGRWFLTQYDNAFLVLLFELIFLGFAYLSFQKSKFFSVGSFVVGMAMIMEISSCDTYALVCKYKSSFSRGLSILDALYNEPPKILWHLNCFILIPNKRICKSCLTPSHIPENTLTQNYELLVTEVLSTKNYKEGIVNSKPCRIYLEKSCKFYNDDMADLYNNQKSKFVSACPLGSSYHFTEDLTLNKFVPKMLLCDKGLNNILCSPFCFLVSSIVGLGWLYRLLLHLLTKRHSISITKEIKLQ